MGIFTPEEREQLRDELVLAAHNDPNLSGAAHTGSAATARLDRWSDIDFALCLKPSASYERVVAAWTELLYQHGAVTHMDVMRGATLFRVFLLKNTLQVDIAFWREAEFGAMGPSFRLIFGEAKSPRAGAPSDARGALIGMAWLYALHVRSSLARGRILQADYMMSGMRNHVFELMCLRCGVIAQQGRGLDDLPAAERESASACIPRSLETPEMKRAFQETMRVLLNEIGHADGELQHRVSGLLHEMIA